jgi:protein TonB
MLNVLLESRAIRPRRAGSTMASALLHGAVIAAAIGLARPHSGGAITPPKPDTSVVYIPMYPETQVDRRIGHRSSGGRAQTGRSIVAIPIFDLHELPPIDLTVAEPVIAEPLGPGPSDGLKTDRGNGGSGLQYDGGVIDERAVDRTPSVIGRAPEPRYPTPLREAGIQGRVVAEFVVDTLGHAEMDGLKLDATQALFGESVRDVLPRYRFTPGEVAGSKVRTRVQLPFDFALRR